MDNHPWWEKIEIAICVIIGSALISTIAAPYNYLTTSWLISLIFKFPTTIGDFWLIDFFLAIMTFIKKLGGF